MGSEMLLSCVVFGPLAGAGVVAALGRWPDLRESASVVTAVALLLGVLLLLEGHSAGRVASLRVVEMLPGLSLAFTTEPLGLLFALVASGLWIVTTLYSVGYMRAHHEEHQTRFFACFAIAISGAMGVALAGNLLTLFVFYELLTFSTYPLVTHSGTQEARDAGRVYLGILVGTSVAFLLLGIVWTWSLAGTLDFRPGGILAGRTDATTTAVLLALFAFGTAKAALMPFHRWLPAAMVAPTPVSALLHAVAVVKAGVFTILKVVVYTFGIDWLSATGTSRWLGWVAAYTILAASVVALTKDNLKARLAYSTVSQLAYIVLGAALATSAGVVGGALHIAMHAFGKITLFFVAGAVMVTLHKTRVSEMDGIGRQMPITMICFGIGSLSIIGLPPMGGSWSKWFLVLGALDAELVPLAFVLLLSSLLNIAYLLPIFARAFFVPAPEGSGTAGIREAPILCLLPLCATALGCLWLFFAVDDIFRFLEPIGRP